MPIPHLTVIDRENAIERRECNPMRAHAIDCARSRSSIPADAEDRGANTTGVTAFYFCFLAKVRLRTRMQRKQCAKLAIRSRMDFKKAFIINRKKNPIDRDRLHSITVQCCQSLAKSSPNSTGRDRQSGEFSKIAEESRIPVKYNLKQNVFGHELVNDHFGETCDSQTF